MPDDVSASVMTDTCCVEFTHHLGHIIDRFDCYTENMCLSPILLFYFLNLAHECRCLPVTCHAGIEDRHAVVLILNLRATWGFTLGPSHFSPEKGPEGQLGQV